LINPLEVSISVNELFKKEEMDFHSGENIWTALVPFFWKKAMML
jgi:hypothetical protein